MTGLAVADLSHIPVSQVLSATLTRASEGARAVGAQEVSLEHVLAALCEDADAIDVLAACQIDAGRLKHDVIGYIVQQSGTAPVNTGIVNVSPDLVRILEAAAAAAKRGKRRDINGAIVLAAIVGDGRSVAAQILQNYGLTFEGAIRALQSAMAQPAPAPVEMRPAEDVLARARERVQSRSAPSLREIMQERGFTPPAPATPAPPPDSRSEPHTFEPALSPAVSQPSVQQPPVQQPPVPQATHDVDAAAPPVSPPFPGPAEPALPVQHIPADPPAAPAETSAPEAFETRGAQPPHGQQGVAPKPEPESGMESAPRTEPAFDEPVVASAPGPSLPAPFSLPAALPEQAPVQPAPSAPPPSFGAPGLSQPNPPASTDPRNYLPAPPPGMGPPGAPPVFYPAAPSAPPVYAAPPGPLPPPSGMTAPTGPQAAGPSMAGPPFAAPSSLAPPPPAKFEPAFERPRSGPQPPPIPPPIPRPGMGAAPAAKSKASAPPAYGGTPPAPASGPLVAAPVPPAGLPSARPGAPAPAEARDGKAEAHDGQLTENIPRVMRVGLTDRVEVRISRDRLRDISAGMDGAGASWQHDIAVTKAMSVRLRAPDGGFFIETASPETQWIENQFTGMGDDYASWRFLVTPQRTGWSDLQIIVSARIIGGDGLAAETAFPDQLIEVKVRRNYGRAALKVAGWALAAIIGGVLAKFGEGAYVTGSGLLSHFIG